MTRTQIELPAWLRNAAVVNDRRDIISEYVCQGSVLDVGIVNSWRAMAPTAERLKQESSVTSLHEFVRSKSQDVLGVDVDEEGIEILRARGYNVLCADVETMALGRRFDTIVAGEIIEHLPNPGLALNNLREHLEPSGNLILTTCNPFFVHQIWKICRTGHVRVHDEHTAWFDPRTLGRLLEMSGFTVKRLDWLPEHRSHGRWKLWPARLRHYFHANFLIVAAPR